MRPDRRALLRRLYGFDFPEDLFSFWEFAKRLRPLEPTLALAEGTDTYLVGPFDVLARRVDDHPPHLPMSLHWRYYDDPPEFFTVLRRGEGGLHWGYYLDEPGVTPGCIASYETDSAFEIHGDADGLFEAVRLDLERHYRDCEELRAEDPARAFEYQVQMNKLDEVRQQLMRSATNDRPETGEAYEERYPERTTRSTQIIARTRDGMGIVAPADTYRPLALANRQLWQRLKRDDDPADLVAEAWLALRDGYPSTALKLGKDLWAVGGERRRKLAYPLLDAAYAGLCRSVLQEVLRAHHRNRDLPGVDILESPPPPGQT
jgi:hypothetical protein